MRALVTGAAGFVGQWLCDALRRRGWEVYGARLDDELPPGALTADGRRAVHWLACDVTRLDDVRAGLDASRPDAVFHLAGVAFIPDASADPGRTLEINTVAAGRLLGEIGVRRAAGTIDPVVLVVGSGEQYGRHAPAEQPLGEGAEQRPLNPYAASKAAQEIVALATHRAAGVRVVATRAFNHSGPGQTARYLVPALVQRVTALHGVAGATLPVGNTTTVRDFLHVADVVEAYVSLCERGDAGECYNVASGHGVDVATIAARVLALAGVDAKLLVDPALIRPVEVPMLVGDATKLRRATGWAPLRTLDTIIEDLIRATAH